MGYIVMVALRLILIGAIILIMMIVVTCKYYNYQLFYVIKIYMFTNVGNATKIVIVIEKILFIINIL